MLAHILREMKYQTVVSCILSFSSFSLADEWNKLPDAVLTGEESWEENCVCEPQVMSAEAHAADSKYIMYYRSGWGTTAVNAAFSDDGVAWEKYANNPLTTPGDKQGGMQPWVTYDEASKYFYLFTTSSDWYVPNIRRSLDGLTEWENIYATIPCPDGVSHYFGNRVMWKEEEKYYLLQEMGNMPSGIWQIFLFSSDDIVTWTSEKEGKPFIELQRHDGAMYGGPSMETVGGQVVGKNETGYYNVYYHAGTAEGNLPTDIFQASSKDILLDDWVVENGGAAILKHSGDTTRFDYDQVADPSRIGGMIYYDGDNNVNATCAIGASTKPQ